jgi:uroporphyrinogen-III synthase
VKRHQVSGRVIATTRAAADADEFVQMLEQAEARVLVWPTLDFEPSSAPESLAAALSNLTDFSWVVFTSPRAIDAAAELVGVLPTRVRVAVVGSSTRRSLEKVGWHADVVGREGAAALVEAIASTEDLSGQRILFPASSLAADTVEREVHRRGGRVDRVEAYRTVPCPPASAAILADLEREVDVVTFTSPSAVRTLASALDPDWPDALSRCGIAAMGPTTAAALVAAGLATERVEVADPVGLEGLLWAVVRALPLKTRARDLCDGTITHSSNR